MSLTTIISIFQMRDLRHRKVKGPSLGHWRIERCESPSFELLGP